jgi:hypothetical protein
MKISDITKIILEKYYCDNELTLIEVGQIFNCSGSTIRNYLIKFGIKPREAAHIKMTEKAKIKISEANKGRKHSEEHCWKTGKANRGKRGDKTTNWKGGKIKDKGYTLPKNIINLTKAIIKIYSHPRSNKQGYVNEAILVMEEIIGRYLTKNEVVHHINRIRGDNRKNNLKLFSNHGKHIEYHNKFDPINK